MSKPNISGVKAKHAPAESVPLRDESASDIWFQVKELLEAADSMKSQYTQFWRERTGNPAEPPSVTRYYRAADAFRTTMMLNAFQRGEANRKGGEKSKRAEVVSDQRIAL